MTHTKQIYTFCRSSKIISKNDGVKSVNVSAKMFMEELIDLCNKNVLLSGTKIKCSHQKSIIYLFDANKKSKMYNAHNVSNVTIKIDYKNVDINIDNIRTLDGLTNDVKNVTTYSICKALFEDGMAKGFMVNGYSLGTYAAPKLTIGLSSSLSKEYKPNDAIYNPSNINSFIVFDHQDNNINQSLEPEKQYVYKN